MAQTVKESRRKLAAAIREERAARSALYAANAAFAKIAEGLPPLYVSTAQARADRRAAEPFLRAAQLASDRLFRAADDLVNARAMVTDKR